MEDNDSIPVAQPMLTNSSAEGHIGFRYNGATYDKEYDYCELVLNQPGDLSATLTLILSCITGYISRVAPEPT